MNQKGVLSSRTLPNDEFDRLWDRIILPKEQKSRIVSQVVLEFTARGKVDQGALPLHGILVLSGPPGTGKTSLAKGVASKAAGALGNEINFIEADPHTLTSSALGKTQRAMQSFLHDTVAEEAERGPLIVLLDEVETMAANRSQLSLEANPIDVHRATDALLAGVDTLSSKYPKLLFIATTNFEKAVDGAFLSRADRVEFVGYPTPEARREILKDTLTAMSDEWAALSDLTREDVLDSVVAEAEGLDGRQVRKGVFNACALDKEVAMNPSLLKPEHLKQAFKAMQPNSTDEEEAP